MVYQNIGHPVNLSKGDAGLIRFLATGYRTHEWEEFLQQVRNVAANGTLKELTALLHEYKRKAQHWAPFGHPHLTLRMTLPIFWLGNTSSIKSAASGPKSLGATCGEPDWLPDEVHARPADIKQGSGGEPAVEQSVALDWMQRSTQTALNTYQLLLDHQVAQKKPARFYR